MIHHSQPEPTIKNFATERRHSVYLAILGALMTKYGTHVTAGHTFQER